MRGKAKDLQRLFHIVKWATILAERCLDVLRENNSNVDSELCEELFEETGIVWEDK